MGNIPQDVELQYRQIILEKVFLHPGQQKSVQIWIAILYPVVCLS